MTGASKEELKELIAEVVKTESDYQRVPKWFLRFVTTVGGLMLAWATWVTYTLMRIETASDFRSISAAAVKAQLDSHLTDQSIHHAAIERQRASHAILEERIRVLELDFHRWKEQNP